MFHCNLLTRIGTRIVYGTFLWIVQPLGPFNAFKFRIDNTIIEQSSGIETIFYSDTVLLGDWLRDGYEMKKNNEKDLNLI